MDNTCERAFFVGKRVNYQAAALLVWLISRSRLARCDWLKTRKRVKLCLLVPMPFFQYFHAVQRGCEFGTDGGLSAQLFPADDFRRGGRIFSFHDFQTRMPGQEFAALHQGLPDGNVPR